jgi:ferredoxin-NADP reductase
MDSFPLFFFKKEDLSAKLSLFHFSRPESFTYQAGQFLSLEIPSLAPLGPLESTRSMSLASAPHESDLLFLMHPSSSKFKQAFFSLSVADQVTAKGPQGHLVVDSQNPNDLVFIAGGVGIAPLRAIVADQQTKSFPQPTYLFYSSTVPADTAFLKEFQSINHPNFHFVPTMTRLPDKHSWSGQQGRLNLDLFKKHLSSFDQKTYYLVGSPSMTRDILGLLKDAGVDLSNLRLEVFTGLENNPSNTGS